MLTIGCKPSQKQHDERVATNTHANKEVRTTIKLKEVIESKIIDKEKAPPILLLSSKIFILDKLHMHITHVCVLITSSQHLFKPILSIDKHT